MCVDLHCHDGIQHLFDLSIRVAFLQLHCLISLVVQLDNSVSLDNRIDRSVG